MINYDLPNVPESYVHRIGRTRGPGAAASRSPAGCRGARVSARHRGADQDAYPGGNGPSAACGRERAAERGRARHAAHHDAARVPASAAAPHQGRASLAATIRSPGRTASMQVFVRDNDVDYALRQLKRKLRREGLLELKRRRACEKPSRAAGQGENRVDTAATQGAAQAARARGLLAARLPRQPLGADRHRVRAPVTSSRGRNGSRWRSPRSSR